MKTLDVSSADFLDMAESPSYNRLSFGGASVSFRAPVSRFASCPFEEGEIVKVVWRGKTLLIGPAIDLEHSLEGTSESWDIRICDYWWNLSNIQYFANGRANGIFAEYRRGTGGSGQEKQATANIRDALSGVLDHAVSTALVPIKYDLRIDKDAEIIPFAYSSETYASLLSQIQKWRPNMAAWFEYGADDSATLVIADHAALPDVVLDLSAVDVSALSLKARPDLVPPAVGLTCNASVVSRIQRALAVYPSGASLSQPYVVTAEVDVPGGGQYTHHTGPRTAHPGAPPCRRRGNAGQERAHGEAARSKNTAGNCGELPHAFSIRREEPRCAAWNILSSSGHGGTDWACRTPGSAARTGTSWSRIWNRKYGGNIPGGGKK